MSKFRVRVITSLFALAALLSGAVPPASAATPDVESFTMIGTGTVTPGYPTTGCAYQPEFAFSSILAVDAGDDALDADGDVPYSAFYRASSGEFCETLNSGQGSGTLYVVDNDGNGWATTVNYFRTSTELELTGQVEINGVAHDILAGICEFFWTDINPSTSYTIDCEVVLDR